MTRQAADGRLADVEGETGSVNGAACGEAVQISGFAEAARRQLDWLVRDAPRDADGTLFHLLDGREVWADTVYMVVPFLAMSGLADVAVAQVEGHRRRLCHGRPVLGDLVGRDVRSLRRADRWGGGNGWVVAGLARAIRLAPSLRADLADHAREVLDACLALRRPDGLFHDVLDDPSTFVETNAAQMFAYAALVGCRRRLAAVVLRRHRS